MIGGASVCIFEMLLFFEYVFMIVLFRCSSTERMENVINNGLGMEVDRYAGMYHTNQYQLVSYL